MTASGDEDRGEVPHGVDKGSGEALLAAIDNDPVVRAIRSGDDLVGRLQAAAEVIAVQVARLRWLELHPESVTDLLEEGRGISRRVRAVKKLVEVEMAQQRHASTEAIDLGSPVVRHVLDLLVGGIEGVAHEVLPWP